jgi:cysteine desulfurase / selenocysteine lyase
VQAEVPDGNASGIVSFRRGDADLTDLHQTLARAHITTSLRMDRAGRRYIRLSPHYYNTDAELERLIEAL